MYYFQPTSGDEEQVPHSLLVGRLADTDGFVQSDAPSSKSDAGTISVAANVLIHSIVVTPSANLTLSVGTAADGTDIIDSESLTSGTTEVFVVNHYFASAGTLHFTLNTGSVTVHVKKL